MIVNTLRLKLNIELRLFYIAYLANSQTTIKEINEEVIFFHYMVGQ